MYTKLFFSDTIVWLNNKLGTIFLIKKLSLSILGGTPFKEIATLKYQYFQLYTYNILISQMMAKADEKPKNGNGTSSSASRSRGNNITIVDDSNLGQSRSRSGCCGGGGSGDHPSNNDIATGNNLSASSR